MVELINHGVYLLNGTKVCDNYEGLTPDEARENTITYGILRSHDVDGSKGKKMRIRFDAMMSHDITYVGIIQTARASGLEEFPLPYAMTNCHNSLCAVGGTINEDDHVFGLSATYFCKYKRRLFYQHIHTRNNPILPWIKYILS